MHLWQVDIVLWSWAVLHHEAVDEELTSTRLPLFYQRLLLDTHPRLFRSEFPVEDRFRLAFFQIAIIDVAHPHV